MENRYLSRGKRIDNGEWVEGFPFLVNDVSYILPHHNTGQPIHVDNLLSTSVEVSKDTICRCTGRTDRDEKLIFEHDVIAYLDTYSTESGCAGPYVKIKEFPNKMDAQGKAKETWNRRVKIEIVKGV